MQMNDGKLCVVGLGYIGLPTAAMFARHGMAVLGVDTAAGVVDTINAGSTHIAEQELAQIVEAAVAAGSMRASLAPEPADAFVIAVPTPLIHESKTCDLRYVEAAARSIAPHLVRGNLVVLESTSPVGTTEHVCRLLAELRPDLVFPDSGAEECDVHVAYCPERVLPGQIIREIVRNDRVIGGMTPGCAAAAKRLYATFVEGTIVETDARTAELCKLTENSYRDVNIAFANELSMICDRAGVDVWELIGLANRHPRVAILQPGVGVGGHCIAIDPWFIAGSWPEEARLIRSARQVNDLKPEWVLGKTLEASARLAEAGKPAADQTVAVLGLAFKANVGDLRESPALALARQLEQSPIGRLLMVEPNIDALPADMERSELTPLDDALARADIVLCCVAHRQFAGLKSRLADGQILVSAVAIDRQAG